MSVQLNDDGKVQLSSATSVSLGSSCCCEAACCLPDCTCKDITEVECEDQNGTWHGRKKCGDNPCTSCPPIDGYATRFEATLTLSGELTYLSNTITARFGGTATFSGSFPLGFLGQPYFFNILNKCEAGAINHTFDENNLTVECRCDSGYGTTFGVDRDCHCTTSSDCTSGGGGGCHPGWFCGGIQNRLCCNPSNANNDPDCDDTFHHVTGALPNLKISVDLQRGCAEWDISVFITAFGAGDGNGCHGVGLGSLWSNYTTFQNDMPFGDFSFDLEHGFPGITGHIDLSLIDENA